VLPGCAPGCTRTVRGVIDLRRRVRRGRFRIDVNRRATTESGPTSPTVVPSGSGEAIEADSLGDGPLDSYVILILRCLRRLSYVLIWIGLSIAVLLGTRVADLAGTLNSPAKILAAMKTPFVVAAVGLALRLLAIGLAFIVAVPPAIRSFRAYRPPTRFRTDWYDIWYLSRAFVSLRWTTRTRNIAVVRTGPAGPVVELMTTILLPLNVVCFAIFVLLLIGVF
jgi:hypothetical protein